MLVGGWGGSGGCIGKSSSFFIAGTSVFLLKIKRYKISKIPRVFMISRAINHHFWPDLADLHNAHPFQKRDQARITKNNPVDISAQSGFRIRIGKFVIEFIFNYF